MYRIILIDDEPLILAGIASLINWIGSRNLKALFYAASESRFYKFPHFFQKNY